MAVGNKAVSFSIAPGSRVAEVLTDDAVNGVTYDTPITINIETATFTDNYFQDESRADGSVFDQVSEFDKLSGSFTLANIDLETIAMLTGNTVTTSGTGDTEVKTLKHISTNQPKYFAFGFPSKYNPDSSIASKLFTLHKCKITSVDMGGGDRAYNKPVINFEAIPRAYDYEYRSVAFCASETAISFTDVTP